MRLALALSLRIGSLNWDRHLYNLEDSFLDTPTLTTRVTLLYQESILQLA